MRRSLWLTRVQSRSISTWFSKPKIPVEKLELISKISINNDISKFTEFKPIPQRPGKFIYTSSSKVPKTVFIENVPDKSFSQAKANIHTALTDYPNEVLSDVLSKYKINIIIYDTIGPSMWQGDYGDGFTKGQNTIFLPMSRCLSVSDVKVYLGERLIEIISSNTYDPILGDDRTVRNKRLKTVGFLMNPKNRFYNDIEQILAENNMHHVLITTLKADTNMGNHLIDLYSEASRYIERRRRLNAIFGFGKSISDKLEQYGIVKKDNLTSWSNILRSNPLIDKWILIVLGGGVSLGGITALLKKAKNKVTESVDKAKEMVVGNKQ